LDAITSGQYDFIRVNYPNGDMVGHTGMIDPTIIAVETVDLALSRLMKLMDSFDFTLLVTADHGNSDNMIEVTKAGVKQPKTAHSLNPVPFIIYDRDTDYKIKPGEYGLANVAPTLLKIMGYQAPKSWLPSIVE
jgi:2,3-bisphosphoglycerate-independent phosphoglycerate mutase